MIPSGPYPPPTPDFTWLGWVFVGVFVLCMFIRFATKHARQTNAAARRQRQAAIRAQSAARARARQRARTR